MKLSVVRVLTGALAVALFSGGLWASDGHMDHGKKGVHKQHQKSIKGTQKVCPIMKGKIDPEVYTKYQGQKVYFCCPGCEGKFIKDSEKKFAEMKERGEVTENIQTICPVSGEALEDHDISVTLPGRKIYLCCKNCVEKFKKKQGGLS
jgi:YHS domain-containing protein